MVSSSGTSDNNRLANTKERDFSIGLDNHGFRYFDPEAGRYVSRDPIGYGDGMNVYVYVKNNPINFVDPVGLNSNGTSAESMAPESTSLASSTGTTSSPPATPEDDANEGKRTPSPETTQKQAKEFAADMARKLLIDEDEVDVFGLARAFFRAYFKDKVTGDVEGFAANFALASIGWIGKTAKAASPGLKDAGARAKSPGAILREKKAADDFWAGLPAGTVKLSSWESYSRSPEVKMIRAITATKEFRFLKAMIEGDERAKAKYGGRITADVVSLALTSYGLDAISKYGGKLSGLLKPRKVPSKKPVDLAKPGEDLYVGTYSKSYRANVKKGINATHTPHHAVQDAVSSTTHGRGITINMRKALHELTRTFRKPVKPGTMREHLGRDVMDVKRILEKAGYDRATVNAQLKELVRQNKALGGFGK